MKNVVGHSSNSQTPVNVISINFFIITSVALGDNDDELIS